MRGGAGENVPSVRYTLGSMTDRESFLRTIAASPDDDAPKLVFADWLDDQGEAERAELIRVKVALAKTPQFVMPEIPVFKAIDFTLSPPRPPRFMEAFRRQTARALIEAGKPGRGIFRSRIKIDRAPEMLFFVEDYMTRLRQWRLVMQLELLVDDEYQGEPNPLHQALSNRLREPTPMVIGVDPADRNDYSFTRIFRLSLEGAEEITNPKRGVAPRREER